MAYYGCHLSPESRACERNNFFSLAINGIWLALALYNRASQNRVLDWLYSKENF